MYNYSKKSLWMNAVFVLILCYFALFLEMQLTYRIVIAFVAVLIIRDAIKEMAATFELTGDRLIIRKKEKVIREIKYKEMKYLTITRKNKKWAVIADDERILFTIKPRIENYEQMVAELIDRNKSNKKLEVHDFIKKTYKNH
jgi:hypothetical protein